MELQIAFSYEENMTKLILMSRLSAHVILKEKRHFEHYWRMKEHLGRPLRRIVGATLAVALEACWGFAVALEACWGFAVALKPTGRPEALEGKPKKYGANAPQLRPILKK